MKHLVELQEFFVEGKKRKESHVLLHITEPSTPEEMEKGYFFALAEIENGEVEQIEHIQQMIDDLESGYYETDDEEGRSAFEVALDFINRRGHHVLNFRDGKINAIVGTIREGAISFAYHGSPIGMVYYQSKGRFQSLSVIDEEQENREHLFSALLEGQIQLGDYFFIATSKVADYLSGDRLEKIITSRSSADSAEHIEKVLANLKSDESFGGIIFHLITKDQLPKTGKIPAHLKQGSADSLNRLISAQRTTDEMLYPPVMQKAASRLSGLIKGKKVEEEEEMDEGASANLKRTRVRVQSEQEPETNIREAEPVEDRQSFFGTLLVEFGKIIFLIFKFIALVLQRILLALRDLFINLFIMATNKGGQRREVVLNIKETIRRREDSFRMMPMASKVLLIGTIISAAIFVGSIVFVKAKESQQAKSVEYNNIVQAIRDKKDAAEASMIYGDEEKAFTLLKEAKDLLETLPTNKDSQEKTATELRTLIDTSLMGLRNVEVATPSIVSNITAAHADAKVTGLTLLQGSLFAFGPEDNRLFKVNKDTGSIEIRDHATIPSVTRASTPKEDDFSLFLTQSGTAASLDGVGNLSQKDISYQGAGPEIRDISVYNRRVYSLDAKNQQIYKHNPIATGYDRGASWITEKQSDLSGATALAIDGDLFVLTTSGIVKFTAGKETAFSVRGLDPSLSNPTQIWTYNDVTNLYVLEPTNRRLIVFSKEGQLLKQITSTDWKNPTAMVVRENENIAYVLDSGIIYKVTL